MKSSVVERGFIANSPSRTLKTVAPAMAFSWFKQGIDYARVSVASSLVWGLGITISLYGIHLLLTSATTGAVAYSSGLIILALFFAGGISATSRQIERQGQADASAVLAILWAAKFNLALMGISLSVLFMGWMTMAVTTAAVSTGSGIAAAGSVIGMLLAVDGTLSTLAIASITLLAMLTAFMLFFVSLPMVVDGDQDFLNAMLTSAAVFFLSPGAVMLTALALIGLVVISYVIWLPLVAVTAPLALHSLWLCYRSLME